MSVYGITGVKLDAAGVVVAATIGKLQTGQLVGMILKDASDIASQIIGGDLVYSLFDDHGELDLGPKFRAITFPGGAEGIELEDDIPGRRLVNMVHIGEAP
jgi:hypothetical protein